MMTERLQLEVPVFGPQAASTAVGLGASQLELNSPGSYADGGLTPALAHLEPVTELGVPLRVMIRPRGPPRVMIKPRGGRYRRRDFIYNDEELAHMAQRIDLCKKSLLMDPERGDAFVFGILEEVTSETPSSLHDPQHTASSPSGQEVPIMRTSQCQVDKERCTRLVELCRPFKAVFHRAFDEIISSADNNPILSKQQLASKALDDLLACGFCAVLTSGGLGDAVNNMDILGGVIEKASQIGIQVVVGGGVRKANIRDLVARLSSVMLENRTVIHSSCISGDSDQDIDKDEIQGIVAQLG